VKTLLRGDPPTPAVAGDIDAEVARLRSEIDHILARDFSEGPEPIRQAEE
jgi:hypothetical protein